MLFFFFNFQTRRPGLDKVYGVSATHFHFLWLHVQFLSPLDKVRFFSESVEIHFYKVFVECLLCAKNSASWAGGWCSSVMC